MSTTNDLNLNKHNNVSTNTDAFDVEKYLNENLDIIDNAIGKINENLDKNADELKNLQKDNTGNKTAIEAINKKNTEQDTNIQKNVKDIEANQNNIKALQVKNAEVKAENERLRDDIKSIALVGEANGESIDLDDSSGARFKKFEIRGNHKQETREGYNILDLGKKPYNEQASSLNGATVTQKNGILTIDAMNATDLVTVKSVWKSYTDSTSIKMQKGNYYTPLTLNISKVESGESVGQKTGNFTLEEDCVCTQWFYNVGKGKKIELPLFISNNQNKTAYEPYGAMPSLKFQSEIKTVKDNVNEVVCNKNLQKNKWENKTSDGASSNYRSTINIDDMNLKLNKKYVIQFKCNVDYSNSTVFVENSITGESLQISKLLYDNINKINYCVIEITEAIKALINKNNCYIIIFNATGMDVNTYSEEMIFEGENKATDYEAHQEQAIKMPTQQEMLKGDYFDWVNEKEVHKWPKLIFDGTENWLQSGNIYPTFYISPDEIASKFGIPTGLKALCNYFTQKSNIWGIDQIGFDTANLRPDHVDFRFCLGSNSTITTLEAWKNKLVEMYNSGNPLVLYFQIFTQDELDFTDEQKAVAKKIKETLHTYKNITHIYSTDETSSVLNVEYAKDLNTQNNNLQNQIDEIKQLISTTQTSAMLLDNLQKEVESEVE